VQVITANSPQAKKHVERNHGTDQDRLVKEMQLKGVSSISEANAFLDGYYLPKINGKFSHPAANATDAHVPLEGVDLKNFLL